MLTLASRLANVFYRLGVGALVQPWILVEDRNGVAAFRPFGRFGAAYRMEVPDAVGHALQAVVLMLGVFLVGSVPVFGLFGWDSVVLWLLVNAIAYRALVYYLLRGAVKVSVSTGKVARPRDGSDQIVADVVRFVLSGWVGFGSLVLAIKQPFPEPLWWVGTTIAVICGLTIVVTAYRLARSSL